MRVEPIEVGGIPEGLYGDALGVVAAARPDVIIGSYPSFADGKFRNLIVMRSKDPSTVAEARLAIEAMLTKIRAALEPL